MRRDGTALPWWLLAGTVGAVCAQTALGGLIDAGGARPDIVLAAVIGVGVLAGWWGGVAAGVIAGWCILALAPQPTWLWPLLYAGLGWLAGLVSHPFDRRSPWLHLLLVCASAVLLGWAVCVMRAPAERLAPTWREVWTWLLQYVAYSGLAGLPVFLVLKQITTAAGGR